MQKVSRTARAPSAPGSAARTLAYPAAERESLGLPEDQTSPVKQDLGVSPQGVS
jgi:hypothetical protein